MAIIGVISIDYGVGLLEFSNIWCFVCSSIAYYANAMSSIADIFITTIFRLIKDLMDNYPYSTSLHDNIT